MIESMNTEFLRILGYLVLITGGIFELIGAIGMLRLRDFQTRAHAATLTVIGGGVLPLLGTAILSPIEIGAEGLYLSIIAVLTSILILVTAPTGIHVLMRVALSDYIFQLDKEKRDQGLE